MSDCRTPILAGADGPPDGWAELAVPDAHHRAAGCACCAPRGPLARALAALWLDATRAGQPLLGVFVRGATPDGLAALLRADVLCAARFRNVTQH